MRAVCNIFGAKHDCKCEIELDRFRTRLEACKNAAEGIKSKIAVMTRKETLKIAKYFNEEQDDDETGDKVQDTQDREKLMFYDFPITPHNAKLLIGQTIAPVTFNGQN